MQSPRTARLVDVLALPGVPVAFGTAVLGRSAYALALLPLLYAVADATGSIALAGTAVGLYGAGAAFLAPVRAWFIDRHGARPVLAVLVPLFGLALAAIAFASLGGAPAALLVALAAFAGAVAPPLGPTMRVAWGRLATTEPLLKQGLSLDAVVEEVLFLLGPVLAGLALAVLPPGVVLLVPAVLVVVGGALFVATDAVGGMRPRPRAGTASPEKKARPLLFERAFVAVLLPALVAGAVSGTLSVAVPVAVAAHGGPAASGIALGLFAGGSAVGGLLYGSLRVPGSPIRQLVALAAALVGVSSLVAVVSGAVAVSVVLAGAGLFFAPIMIVAYLAAHDTGGEERANAATTWVNTSHNAGSSAGSAAAGVLIQAAGVPTAIAVIAVVSAILLVSAAALAARPRAARGRAGQAHG